MNKYEKKYRNTAQKMQNALLFLIERKDFKDITVSEICKKAAVNRTTFYLHYDNVYQLLQEISSAVIEEYISGYQTQITVEDLPKYPVEKLVFNTPEYLIPYLEFVKKNKTLYKVYTNNMGELNSDYAKTTNAFFSAIIRKHGFDDETVIKYMAKFYFVGVMAIVLEWVNNDCKEDVEKLCEVIGLCTRFHK